MKGILPYAFKLLIHYRKIQEMAEQYENTNQMLRERMLVGSGAGDDVKRENAQLRAQVIITHANGQTLIVDNRLVHCSWSSRGTKSGCALRMNIAESNEGRISC